MTHEVYGPIGNVAQHTLPFFATRRIQVPAFAEAERQVVPEKWAPCWPEGRPVRSARRHHHDAGNPRTCGPKAETPRAAQPRCASLVLGTLGKVEGVQQVVGGGIAGSQGRKAPSPFDQFENRGRFVVRVINKPPLCKRRDDDGRHA